MTGRIPLSLFSFISVSFRGLCLVYAQGDSSELAVSMPLMALGPSRGLRLPSFLCLFRVIEMEVFANIHYWCTLHFKLLFINSHFSSVILSHLSLEMSNN